AVDAHTHDMDFLQYYFNGYMIPPSLFQKLEEAPGSDQFTKNIRTFYQMHQLSHPTIDDLQRVFEENDPQSRNFDWFFKDILTTIQPFDIAITDVSNRGDNFVITLENKGAIVAPALVKAYDGKKVVASTPVDAFRG